MNKWSLWLPKLINLVTIVISKGKTKRSAVIFPKNQRILEQLGENIKLAYKRRLNSGLYLLRLDITNTP